MSTEYLGVSVQAGLATVECAPCKVAELFGLFDDFSPTLEIVEPRPDT